MKHPLVPVSLLAAMLLGFTACAKPPVRSYPRPAASDVVRRPPPATPQGDVPQQTPQADAAAPETSPSPAAPYDHPVAPIGRQPTLESGSSDDYLLAVVTPLADQARRQLASGELAQAQTTAERAVRIDPNNADLWHLMGKIQLAQANFGQAEQLARKSNLLAKGDTRLQARNWRLIAESHRRRHNSAAAAAALEKARRLESR
jgi:tetratricopeptide (TPR) repeat protein